MAAYEKIADNFKSTDKYIPYGTYMLEHEGKKYIVVYASTGVAITEHKSSLTDKAII